MKKISHCLWFDGQAEEAANFYASLFPDGSVGRIARYSGAGTEVHGQPEGKVMTVEFSIAGQDYLALNGGPQFRFNEAFSIIVKCDNQAEIDNLWAMLTREGQEVQCGWLKDKYGVSWQIVPKNLGDLIAGPKAGAVMNALMQMKKLDVEELIKASL